MRRTLLRALLPVLAIVLAVGAVAGVVSARGSSSDLTRARLERSLPVTFANIYEQQAKLLGHDGVTAASVRPTAMCDKGDSSMPDLGPGGDWVCLMGWTDPNVAMPAEGYGKFELNVHSNGCYTAVGPTKLTGYLTLTDTNGRVVTNPAFEFDGCLDPASDSSPTGVSYPSVVSVASPSITPDASGHAAVRLTCGPGDGGCVGTMTVTTDGVSLGSAPVKVAEALSADVALPGAVPAGAKQVEIAVHLSTGVGIDDPVTVPVTR